MQFKTQRLNPTKENYTDLDKAYAFFNRELFYSELPNCLITMQRKNGTRGYFSGDRWEHRGTEGELVVDEIALNPQHFKDRSTPEILSTLVHEMCHLWQHHFGKYSRNGYHNKQWASKMETVGLIASSTGQPGGKKIGYRMTHYIEKGGVFDQACSKLVKTGFELRYSDRVADTPRTRSKAASKTKHTCPACGLNLWGRQDANVICGDCDIPLQPQG